MSDNEDLLGDDLGDHSLADYNLGNEEEEQLLADDYESNSSQNVPASVGPNYGAGPDLVSPEYPRHGMDYGAQPLPYQPGVEPECVVPNITVEIPNTPIPDHSTYAPYEPPAYEIEHAVVPPAIPAAPLESPQIVPSDMPPNASSKYGEIHIIPRERFTSERTPGSQRLPQIRDIPDSLDKVVIPRGGRGRTTWRNPQLRPQHPYRRNNMHRGNFNQRPSFPPPQIRPTPPQVRPDIRPEMRHEMRPDVPPEIRPEIHQVRPEIRPEVMDIRMDTRPDMRPDNMRPDMRPDMRPEVHPNPNMRPDMHPDMRSDMRPDMRPDIHQDMRPEGRPNMRPDMRPDFPPEIRPDFPPEMRPELRHDPHMPPQMGPEISPERPLMPDFRPDIRPFGPRFQFRPEEPHFRPNFEPRPMFFRPNFNPRPFGPPVREIMPGAGHIPQVTIRQHVPVAVNSVNKVDSVNKFVPKREQEVIMLPVQLPPLLPPGGLAGKKVLINPHFKGNFTHPVEVTGLPAYIPTRIQKSPPPSPTLESKFGPVKDIDDAAERFIAEQRNALARAANRKFQRRSPQRFIENTTIEIENDMMGGPTRRSSDDELLRRQEQFINANRAGLRRRMRSPSPARRSPSPARRSPERFERPERSDRERPDRERADRERRHRPDTAPAPRTHDEESEYRRRVREQESLRERVLRAKEVRRRRNAAALHKQLQERERERQGLDKDNHKESKPEPASVPDRPVEPDSQPDTTRKSPDKPAPKPDKVEKVRERSPVKDDSAEVNSTCENLTPPRPPSPERALTPPLPEPKKDNKYDSDDDLDLILGDIDGILSDDEDTGRFKDKDKPAKAEPAKPAVDLRARIGAGASVPARRQKIVFHEKKKEKSPPRRAVVTSSTKADNSESDKKSKQVKPKPDASTNKSRQRITFDSKEDKEKEKDDDKKQSFPNRRVILQRKTQPTKDSKSVFSRIDTKTDPTKPHPGIFSRAVRTAIGSDTRIVIKKHEEPHVEFESDSDLDEDKLLDEEIGNVADVTNLPHGMTDTRLKTLAGNDVQSLSLDKEERRAKITFKTTVAAETFKKKFNNKMVAASRLTVSLR